jgi:GNAT superfamily N-acetyltransferase/catechol 2,3-dioxygenase-like lactoylglutathione lyase family enzyme
MICVAADLDVREPTTEVAVKKAHFILFVRDQERSTEFYRAALDMPPRLHVPGMTEFELPGGGVLGLMPEEGAARLLGAAFSALPSSESPRSPSAAPSSRPPRSELYLLVSDPASFNRRALAAGAREASALAERNWGHEAAYSLDPDGHVIAFARELPEDREAVPGLVLRSATPEDVPLILRFICALAEYERMANEVVATEEVLRQSLFGARPAAEVVLAELDGEPVGIAHFFHNFSTFVGRRGLYLEDLFVLPEHRGRGVGLALLRHLAKLCVERGCGRLEWAVLDWNESAIGFYDGLGARPMSDWIIYRLTGDALAKLAEGTRPG